MKSVELEEKRIVYKGRPGTVRVFVDLNTREKLLELYQGFDLDKVMVAIGINFTPDEGYGEGLAEDADQSWRDWKSQHED
jgi:hypothetical protein